KRLGLFEMNERRRHDEPALAFLFLLLGLHFLVGVMKPIVGDVIHPLDGLLAVSARRKGDQHFVVGVGGLGKAVLQTQTLGFIVPGFLGDDVGVLGVFGDLVIDLLGLGIFTATEELMSACQIAFGRTFDTPSLRFEMVALKHQTLGRTRRRLGRLKDIE